MSTEDSEKLHEDEAQTTPEWHRARAKGLRKNSFTKMAEEHEQIASGRDSSRRNSAHRRDDRRCPPRTTGAYPCQAYAREISEDRAVPSRLLHDTGMTSGSGPLSALARRAQDPLLGPTARESGEADRAPSR